MNGWHDIEEAAKKVLNDANQHCQDNIKDAIQWRRNRTRSSLFCVIVMTPLYCVDCYQTDWLWAAIDLVIMTALSAANWLMCNYGVKLCRKYKMAWAALRLRAQKHLHEVRAHREKGFE